MFDGASQKYQKIKCQLNSLSLAILRTLDQVENGRGYVKLHYLNSFQSI